MPVLDATARKAVSRRLIKLPTEISIFAETSTNLGEASSAYNDVDYSNNLFLAEWLAIADAYLGEREILSGEDFVTFTTAEVTTAFTDPAATNKFYPFNSTLPNGASPPPGITNLPNNFYIIPQVNQYTADVWLTTPARTIANITEENIAKAYRQLIITLTQGIGGTGAALTTSLNSPYAGGATVEVVDATNISNDSVIIIDGNDGGVPAATNYAVYVISGGGTAGVTSLNVMPIGGTLPIVVAGSTVIIRSGVVDWTDAARANFPSAPYVHAATGISTWMNAKAQAAAPSWKSYLNSEHTSLLANIDPRTTQAAEITTALANTDILTCPISLALTTWFALPSPGTRFQDVGLLALNTPAVARITQLNTRKAQISTAIGSVTDNGDGTYTTVAGAVAYKYEWVDKRINKAYGSLSETDNADSSKNIVDQQYNSAVSAKANYDLTMVAAPLKDEMGDLFSDMDIMADPNYEPRPLNVIQVEWLTGFNALDNVYVIDEVNPELSGYILETYSEVAPVQPDPNVTAYNYYMVLSFDVPLTYTADNLARVYKVL